MLHAVCDLSRKRLDVSVLDELRERVHGDRCTPKRQRASAPRRRDGRTRPSGHPEAVLADPEKDYADDKKRDRQ